MRKLLPFVVIGILVASIYRHASREPVRDDYAAVNAPAAAPDPAALQVERSANEPPKFRCDGRERCPQMNSCEEARYFLANCPGVKMDGDRDGIPCEDQWCSQLR